MQAALGSGDSTREAQLLETWKAYKKGFQQGIALFNLKPKKGIAYLQVCWTLHVVLRSSFTSWLLQIVKGVVRHVPCHQCTGTQDAHGPART